MKFLEILGLSVVTTVGILLFACTTAWLCTFTIGSWVVLALFVACMLFMCIKTSSRQTLVQVLWDEIFPVCFGFAIMLGIFWFAGNFITERLNMQATIGYNIVWGALSLISLAALFITIIFTLLLFVKVIDKVFLKQRGATSAIQCYSYFIATTLCSLAIIGGTMYYILYPIGLA